MCLTIIEVISPRTIMSIPWQMEQSSEYMMNLYNVHYDRPGNYLAASLDKHQCVKWENQQQNAIKTQLRVCGWE